MKGNYMPMKRTIPFDDVLKPQNDSESKRGSKAGPNDEPLVMLSLRIPIPLKTRLKTAAGAHNLPMQQLLRQAITHELDQLDSQAEET